LQRHRLALLPGGVESRIAAEGVTHGFRVLLPEFGTALNICKEEGDRSTRQVHRPTPASEKAGPQEHSPSIQEFLQKPLDLRGRMGPDRVWLPFEAPAGGKLLVDAGRGLSCVSVI